MWGNFAGDGSNEGISTENISCSTLFIFAPFLGVILFVISKSCNKGCSNNDEISLDGGPLLGMLALFEPSLATLESFKERLDWCRVF